jgi:hypothetical protein
MNVSPPRSTLRLLDLTALVVGYGLAALLIRAFWHSPEWSANAVSIVLGLVYLWLGMAMSGPIVLLLDRRASPRAVPHRRPGRWINEHESDPEVATPPRVQVDSNASEGFRRIQMGESSHYTRSEMAWLAIGAYWIGMTFLVVPTKLHDTPLALFAVLQGVAALALWVFVPRRGSPEVLTTAWTHRAAIVVLATWPAAWIAMVLLSNSL